ncbi:RloB family protein [Thiomicrospira sp. WB1]|uniref:RloB family protein n=1 Tax=Thiomicrospira sp. WB1 TaxID=1685380 RepID=UPI000745FD83|nr:RloB family protein [Thiomicrospira sp. WB1]KUJ72836.1 hypothetical protein AVO41_03380 [Thiomicrospira sp. WB1]
MPRQRRSFNRISGVKDPSLIVIACEGEVTELAYFEGVREKLDEAGSKLKIKPLPARENSHSAPKYVLDQMDSYKKQYGKDRGDELCLVIDRDEQAWETSAIADVAQQCFQKDYLLALSNPCFELWLLLHHEDVDNVPEELKRQFLENNCNCRFIKSRLVNVMDGFNPANLRIDDFWEKTNLAIDRARSLDVNPGDRWPNTLATRVYLIMEKVLDRLT